MLSPTPSSLSVAARRVRCGILGVAIAPIVGSFLYNQGYRVPLLGCPIRYLTGVPCPTCGMTRSFMAIARGDLGAAIQYHWFGPLLFTVGLVAIVHLSLELKARRPIGTPYTKLFMNQNLQILSFLVFLGYYLYRLDSLFRSGELYTAIVRSPLGHLLGIA